MKFESQSFRQADRILGRRLAWLDLRGAIEELTTDAILDEHMDKVRERRASKKKVPAGAQQSINKLFRERLPKPIWDQEPRLFEKPPKGIVDDPLRFWKMDFLRDRIGVEVSFNHAEATAWQFTRLNIAGESERIKPSSVIDVGIVITASRSLKSWGRMDSAILTFDVCQAWLEHMKAIIPTPILLIGLQVEDSTPNLAFRGTGGDDVE